MLIGEVARRSGVSARMLRHYDRLGIVSPTGRTSGGYRRYAEDDLRRLFHVEGLRSLGLSLGEIKATVGDGSAPTELVELLLDRARARLAATQELVQRLEQVQATEPRAWPDVLRTVALMRGFTAEAASERVRHALSLVQVDERDAVVLVDAVLREPDVNAAGALHWALARAGDAVVAPLAGALASADAGRRRRALDALERIDSPAARAALAEQTAHADPRVRSRAQFARARGGDAEAVQALVAHVVDGRDDVEAGDLLAELASANGDHTARAVADALAMAAATAPPDARRRIAATLASLPGPAATATLAALAEDPDRAVALTAAALLPAADAAGPDLHQQRGRGRLPP